MVKRLLDRRDFRMVIERESGEVKQIYVQRRFFYSILLGLFTWYSWWYETAYYGGPDTGEIDARTFETESQAEDWICDKLKQINDERVLVKSIEYR